MLFKDGKVNTSDRTNLILFIIVLTLVGLGLNILLASSSFLAKKAHGDAYFFLKKQSLFALLGVGLFITLSQLNFRIWQKLSWPLYVTSIILLLLVFVPGLGKRAGGATRWIQVAGLSIQPSDLAKFATMLVMARLLSKSEEIRWGSIIVMLFIILTPVGLIGIEPDFGTALHLIFAVVMVLFVTGFPLRLLGLAVVLSIPVIYKSIINVPYRWERVKAFLDPVTYRFEGAYQLVASFKAFNAGGLAGKGFGEGLRRHNLQARHTDFILAVVAEDLGLFGVALLLLLLFGLSIYAIFLLSKVQDQFGRLLGFGIVFLFITQVTMNVAVTMGLIPTTGINLPLISNGGTSLVTYLAMLGILLSITREST